MSQPPPTPRHSPGANDAGSANTTAPGRALFPMVVHTLVMREQQLLLMRRANTGFADGSYQPPGGHVHAGESVTDAARRECREEARIEIAAASLTPVCVMPYRSAAGQGVDFIFACTDFAGEPGIGEPHKCDHLAWFAADALPSNVVQFLPAALHCWRTGHWFHEFGY